MDEKLITWYLKIQGNSAIFFKKICHNYRDITKKKEKKERKKQFWTKLCWTTTHVPPKEEEDAETNLWCFEK